MFRKTSTRAEETMLLSSCRIGALKANKIRSSSSNSKRNVEFQNCIQHRGRSCIHDRISGQQDVETVSSSLEDSLRVESNFIHVITFSTTTRM